jgi:xanthine/uracil permease
MEVLPPPVTPDKAPQIVYGLEERIPLGPALLVGVQHVSAMVVGTITPPLILAGVLKFSPADTAYLVSIALLASAFGTWLQCRQRGPVGSGLLSVTGTSFAFLQPLTLAGQAGGLALMLGMSTITAPLLIMLAPFVSRPRSPPRPPARWQGPTIPGHPDAPGSPGHKTPSG